MQYTEIFEGAKLNLKNKKKKIITLCLDIFLILLKT